MIGFGPGVDSANWEYFVPFGPRILFEILGTAFAFYDAPAFGESRVALALHMPQIFRLPKF